MVIRLRTISYPVRDLEVAREFYERVFERAPLSASAAEVRFDVDWIHLQLVPDLRPNPPVREGILLTWIVPDVDRAIAATEACGGEVVVRRGTPTTNATVKDPFGNYVALAAP
jgi:predicted enzyme related to lactoylglutathione lyase